SDARGDDREVSARPGFLLARLDGREVRARCCRRHYRSFSPAPGTGHTGKELAACDGTRTSDVLVPPPPGAPTWADRSSGSRWNGTCRTDRAGTGCRRGLARHLAALRAAGRFRLPANRALLALEYPSGRADHGPVGTCRHDPLSR